MTLIHMRTLSQYSWTPPYKYALKLLVPKCTFLTGVGVLARESSKPRRRAELMAPGRGLGISTYRMVSLLSTCTSRQVWGSALKAGEEGVPATQRLLSPCPTQSLQPTGVPGSPHSYWVGQNLFKGRGGENSRKKTSGLCPQEVRA